MKQITFICLLTIIVSMAGCDRDDDERIISNMPVYDFEIHVSDISEEIKEIIRSRSVDINAKYYAVTILVSSELGGCRSYEQTLMFYDIDNTEIEIDLSQSNLLTWHGNTPNTWMPGDTFRIELTESESTADGFCPDIVYDWYQAIFIGFFVPGKYTIIVNTQRKTFTIDE